VPPRVPPPLPPDEAERVAALHALEMLDAPAEATYRELVELAADLLSVPVAAVNLIDAGRQWTLAGVGIDHGDQVGREDSFCAYAVADTRRPFVVEDTHADPRFAGNPFVDDGMRFYAGVPLVTPEGHGVGTLCVADQRPRSLDERQVKVLVSLARRAASELELRREKLRAEAASDQLTAVLRHAPDAFVALDRTGAVTEWNRRAEELFGFSRTAAMGRSLSELIVPAGLRAAHDAGLARVAAGGAPRLLGQTLDLPALRADGTALEVELTIATIGAGDATRFNAFIRDITERKRAEDEARAAREFQRAMLESLQEGIVACDAEGRLSLFNRASRELHGLDREDLPPDAWVERYRLLGADGRTPLTTDEVPLFRAFRGEVVRDSEMVIAAEGTDPITVSANGQPIHDEHGRLLGAVVAMHDITERRRAERLKDEFLALVSHELRTPLASIVGYVEMLREDEADAAADGRGDPHRERWLEVVERNASRLERLVGDLLFVAQLEGSAIGFAHVPCDLATIAREALEAAAPRAAQGDVALHLTAAGDTVVHGDPDRLGQAIDNLLSNALKYTPAGGRVVVAIEPGPLGPRVAITDTGIGIPAAEQRRLFDRFFRASTATERHIPGVGLGLVIVRAIAEGHGGAVSAESVEGEGSTFALDLPAAPAAPSAAQPAVAASSR
jgi:PAS domain S-box-containing protein